MIIENSWLCSTTLRSYSYEFFHIRKKKVIYPEGIKGMKEGVWRIPKKKKLTHIQKKKTYNSLLLQQQQQQNERTIHTHWLPRAKTGIGWSIMWFQALPFLPFFFFFRYSPMCCRSSECDGTTLVHWHSIDTY